MTSVALMGAGGKMGCRLTDNFLKTDHEVAYVEPGEAGRARLAERGVTVSEASEAVPEADAVILAVPDNLIATVSEDLVPQMKAGATLIVLDAAAPYGGVIPMRDDLSYVACHPTHPSIFNRDEETKEGAFDYFGGIAGRQDVVIAVWQGDDATYERAEPLIRAFFAPVVNAHRITLKDMIYLEPVLAETTAAACVTVIHDAMQEAVRRGVPEAAARAFILGHVNIEFAIVFGEAGNPFSDGALKAIHRGREILFKEDWKRVYDDDCVAQQVDEILHT